MVTLRWLVSGGATGRPSYSERPENILTEIRITARECLYPGRALRHAYITDIGKILGAKDTLVFSDALSASASRWVPIERSPAAYSDAESVVAVTYMNLG